MHIILCSDDPEIAHTVQAVVTDGARRVTTCESGMELLAAVKTLAADVVVLDLGMHGLGGPLLASAVRELAQDIPIVAVSSSGSGEAHALAQYGIPHVVLGGDGAGSLRELVTDLAGRRKQILGAGTR